MRKRKVLAGLLVPVLLALSACGSNDGSTPTDEPEPSATPTESDCVEAAGAGTGSTGELTSETIEGVTVTGDLGTEPTVEVDAPLEVTETQVIVRSEGAGDVVPETATVAVQYAGYNARTGKSFDSSWTRGMPVSFSLQGVVAGFAKAIAGQRAGSQVVVAMTAEDGYGEEGQPPDIKPGDALVFVIDILLQKATGTAQEVPATVPQLQLNKECIPTGFETTDEVPDEVTESSMTVLVEGQGPEVEAGQLITVHYLGAIYPDGEVFDQSWERGEPATFGIGVKKVIPCWDDLVPGATIGSRLILLCTSDDAYGDEDYNGLPGGSTLTFAVDILAAQPGK